MFRRRTNTNQFQGVFDVDFATGLTLIEIADGVTVDEVKAKTEAPFHVAEDLKPML
jgi:3-oxoacid CoA-transferase